MYPVDIERYVGMYDNTNVGNWKCFAYHTTNRAKGFWERASLRPCHTNFSTNSSANRFAGLQSRNYRHYFSTEMDFRYFIPEFPRISRLIWSLEEIVILVATLILLREWHCVEAIIGNTGNNQHVRKCEFMVSTIMWDWCCFNNRQVVHISMQTISLCSNDHWPVSLLLLCILMMMKYISAWFLHLSLFFFG